MFIVRVYRKVQMRLTLNAKNQENLETKLEGNKDIGKWESILKLTFEVIVAQYLIIKIIFIIG